MCKLLIHCPHCGKIFKIIRAEHDEKISFITDFNDKFIADENYNYHCISCGGVFDVTKNSMTTESWIADMLFKVKGK